MNVLFTSDLDRTLIFSKRRMLENTCYISIEQLNDQTVSYMSATTYERLAHLHAVLDFVPVTTRSLQQYTRLTLFQHDLTPKVAIVANGGVILRNGKIDEVWQQHIYKKQAALPLLYEQVQNHFSSLFTAPFVKRLYEVDSLFFVLTIEDGNLLEKVLSKFQIDLEEFEWTCYLLGRKLYILPCFLTKGAAVQYIKSQKSYEWHVAAGDSMMDLSMLELADTCFIPQHGELEQAKAEHGLPVMKETSSNFSDVFLQQIMEEISVKDEKGELNWSI